MLLSRGILHCCVLALCGCLAAGCRPDDPQPSSAPPRLARELALYNWPDDIPRSVLEAFTREFGVKVVYQTFQSQEEAVAALLDGKVYDVAVLENPFIPPLVAANRLKELNFRHIPNFRNISANFRDLAADPGNRYTVPYHYGTTGLLVRTDLVGQTVRRWSDLWQPRLQGKVAMRAQSRELLGLTLLSLGYSLNSEKPSEIDAAVERLIALKPQVRWVEVDTPKAVAKLLDGSAPVLLGWPMDYQVAHAANPAVAYILPEEGTALWSDNYVIPASSPNVYTAEVFINFLLRPEISAQIVNERSYPTANEAALDLIKPEVRNDPVIFPPAEALRRAHFYRPLSREGETLYQRAWDRFLAAPPALDGQP
jgi:spermidine/putrescine transport system substrate-binding protein